MSLSLAKRSLRSFDLADAPKEKQPKKKQPKLKQAATRDEKAKKLMMMTSTALDDKVSKRVSGEWDVRS